MGGAGNVEPTFPPSFPLSLAHSLPLPHLSNLNKQKQKLPTYHYVQGGARAPGVTLLGLEEGFSIWGRDDVAPHCLPHPKQPCLGPAMLENYQPVSNFSFLRQDNFIFEAGTSVLTPGIPGWNWLSWLFSSASSWSLGWKWTRSPWWVTTTED